MGARKDESTHQMSGRRKQTERWVRLGEKAGGLPPQSPREADDSGVPEGRSQSGVEKKINFGLNTDLSVAAGHLHYSGEPALMTGGKVFPKETRLPGKN